MSEIPFERLFSMSAFEAFRGLRRYQQSYPVLAPDELLSLALRIDADFASLDSDAGQVLTDIIQQPVPVSGGVEFYQSCIEALIVSRRMIWARTLTLGRRKLIQKLSRDEQQCFREAGLLSDPPTEEVIAWWDRIASKVRHATDQDKIEQARFAERLSLEIERARLISLGINRVPEWIAIEDNTAGYDVLSFDPGNVAPTNRLIEVKSTVASPLRFYLTRNEWEQAKRFGSAYHFHIWNLATHPPTLYERSTAQVELHVPKDSNDGKWKTVEIPIGGNV